MIFDPLSDGYDIEHTLFEGTIGEGGEIIIELYDDCDNEYCYKYPHFLSNNEYAGLILVFEDLEA